MGSRAELIEDIASTLNREDVIQDGNAGRWVKKATQRLNQQLRLLEMCRHVVKPVTGNKFVVPSDFIAVHILKINADPSGVAGDVDYTAGRNIAPLRYQTPSEVNKLLASRTPNFCRPEVYTVHGMEFEFAPFLSTTPYQIDLRYYAELRPLIEDGDTNYILDKFFDLYAKAALVYGYRHIMEFDLSDKIDAAVEKDIAALNERKENQKYGDGPLVMAPPDRRMGGRFS